MSKVASSIAPASGGRQPKETRAARVSSIMFREDSQDRQIRGFAPQIKRLPSSSQIEAQGLSSATLIGEAGANLVLSRLQGWGIPAYPAMPGLAYDLIAEIPRLDLLRIQVKTRSKPNGRMCKFHMRRGYHRSRSGFFHYKNDDFDIGAFVCLSLSRVFFYPGPVARISVRTAWLMSQGIDKDTFDLSLRAIRKMRNAEALTSLPSPCEDPSSDDARNDGDTQAEFDFRPRR